MSDIKRLKPLLEFEVIDINGVIIKVKAMSYEANGNYVTFFQGVEVTEIIDNVNTILKRKIPFLTLKDVFKVSLINLNDEYNLVTENNEEYKFKIPQKQFEFKKDTVKEIFQEKRIHKFNSITVPNNINKVENTEQQSDINNEADLSENININEELNNNNDEILLNADDNKELIEEESIDDNLMYDLINNNNGSSSSSSSSSKDSGNDDLLALLNDDFESEQAYNLSDSIDSNELQLPETQDITDVTNNFLHEEYNNLSDDDFDKKSESDFNKSAKNILDKINDLYSDDSSYPSSESERNFNSIKYNAIKENLNEYLNRVQIKNFRVVPFTKYINERESGLGINEDDVISQVCCMIKNKEINYQRFWNQSIQDTISKNKDIVEVYYNGAESINNVLKLMNNRSEEARAVTMIDLVVYLRKNNYYK